MTDTTITPVADADLVTERIPRAAGGWVTLTTGGKAPGWKCQHCDSNTTGGDADGVRLQALVHAQVCRYGLDPWTTLVLVASACELSIHASIGADGCPEYEVICSRETCEPLRGESLVGLTSIAMAHAVLHTSRWSPQVAAEIDRLLPIGDGDGGTLTRVQATERLTELADQLRETRANANADATRMEELLEQAEKAATDAAAEVALLEKALYDLLRQIRAHRTDIADHKRGAMLIAAGLATAAILLGPPALETTGSAAIAAVVAAATGAVSLIAAVATIWRADRTTGTEHTATPGVLTDDARALAADPAGRDEQLGAELRDIARVSSLKAGWVGLARIGTAVTGAAALIAVILDHIAG